MAVVVAELDCAAAKITKTIKTGMENFGMTFTVFLLRGLIRKNQRRAHATDQIEAAVAEMYVTQSSDVPLGLRGTHVNVKEKSASFCILMGGSRHQVNSVVSVRYAIYLCRHNQITLSQPVDFVGPEGDFNFAPG